MADPRRTAPVLEVRGLDVYYGSSHALQGVDLTLDSGVLSVVGRNGMGKTTLCKTIMGLVRATGGSVRLSGEDLLSLQPAQIARLGVGYVPQGRRLWRSLTVEEHLRMIAGTRRGAWTIERIYDTFPRLAERKNHGGAQLSGGEQQMLAIARALVTNPRLLLMDEPTEGLAPVIVAQVEDMLVRLGEEGDISVLVIEQNIGVATAVSKNVAIMVNGRVNRLIESSRLASDRDLQQRLLGVGRHAAAESDVNAETNDGVAGRPISPRPQSLAPQRVYISNPTPPTRWSQPTPSRRCCRPRSADKRLESMIRLMRPLTMIATFLEIAVATPIFCSITSTEMSPSSPRRTSISSTCATMTGASPSVGSSMTRRSGLVSNAREIASICCSPPESCAPP